MSTIKQPLVYQNKDLLTNHFSISLALRFPNTVDICRLSTNSITKKNLVFVLIIYHGHHNDHFALWRHCVGLNGLDFDSESNAADVVVHFRPWILKSSRMSMSKSISTLYLQIYARCFHWRLINWKVAIEEVPEPPSNHNHYSGFSFQSKSGCLLKARHRTFPPIYVGTHATV